MTPSIPDRYVLMAHYSLVDISSHPSPPVSPQTIKRSQPFSSCCSSDLVLHAQEAERAVHRAKAEEEPQAHSPLMSRELQYPSASPGLSPQPGTGSATTHPGLHGQPSVISRLARGSGALVERSVAGESVSKVGVMGGVMGVGEVKAYAALPDGDINDGEAVDELGERLRQQPSLPL